MTTLLVRYGAMAEVARFAVEDGIPPTVGEAVVVRSSRGEELGTVVAPASAESPADLPAVLRVATAADRDAADRYRAECHGEFPVWQGRIREWGVDLELIDLERTLDGEKLVLYVLNDRGPETTKLALRAAAAGFGVIEVQPVGPEGLIHVASGGGCGNCGHRK